jgi:amidohydrolase
MDGAGYNLEDIRERIGEIEPEVRALRHDFHRHPELGYKEVRTSSKVVEYLSALDGWEVESGLAETGVIATLGRELQGPAVALRADMDALPIEEKSGVPYASEVPGVMHACGHDGHTAMLLGAAKVLSELRKDLAGPVRLIFQPAEEGGAGGRRMVEDGALENPGVAAVFGIHNMPFSYTQAGQFCLCPGAAMAATVSFDLNIKGKGGHAAVPHVAVDPIYLGSLLITALQSLISRQTDPVASAVLSFTQFHAGNAYNVIPDTAALKGTIRALDDVVMARVSELLQEEAPRLAAAFGGSAEVIMHPGYPVTRNHPRSDDIFRSVLKAVDRFDDYVEVPPMMGGEDFAFYQQKVPGTFWFLAGRPPETPEVPFCHHPAFDFNDDTLADGMLIHVETARQFARLWETEGVADA